MGAVRGTARVRWLSLFEMEPVLSVVLVTGVVSGMGLMAAGFIVGTLVERVDVGYRIQAISIPRLVQADLHRVGLPDFWSRLLIDLGFSILLVTPYARLVVTWLYLAFVKHRWRYAVYTSIVLVLLGIVLFSDVVVAPDVSGFPIRVYLGTTRVRLLLVIPP